MDIRDQVYAAVEKSGNLPLVANWIHGGLISNGRWFVHSLTHIRISGSIIDRLRFTCRCKARTSPDFDTDKNVKYVFTFSRKSGKYKGVITNG